jgi:hypothetical protein
VVVSFFCLAWRRFRRGVDEVSGDVLVISTSTRVARWWDVQPWATSSPCDRERLSDNARGRRPTSGPRLPPFLMAITVEAEELVVRLFQTEGRS